MSFQPEELARLSIDLRLEPFIIKDTFSIRWKSEAGLVDNIESIVEEYKETRQLLVSVHLCQIKTFYQHNFILTAIQGLSHIAQELSLLCCIDIFF